MIRGRSADNPVLLFLAGGPGGSELGAMRRHSQALEDDFVVVTFDQRGTGKSYDQLDPTASLTLEQAVADTLEVTRYLRDRFGQDQVYLVGQSWGTLLGVLAVQQQPELYSAFVGVGQMVSPAETDRIFYRDTLAWARDRGDTELVATLTDSGAPPYDEHARLRTGAVLRAGGLPLQPRRELRGRRPDGREHLRRRVHAARAAARLRRLPGHLLGALPADPGHRLPHPGHQPGGAGLPGPGCPRGAADARTRRGSGSTCSRRPSKKLVTFDTSGHRPLWEQPAEFHDLMTTVLAETGQNS